MNSFLFELAKELYTKYNSKLSNCTLVFSNKRAGLFFKKYLNSITQEPIWSPEIISISELIQKFSFVNIDDKLSLIFKLYKIYTQTCKSNESFDEFYYWGETLLNDFDDIDKHNVNPKHLFSNLKDIKDIEDIFDYLTENQISVIKKFWKSFNQIELSKQQNEFINLWDNLYNIYTTFQHELKKDELAYEGMLYKKIIENIHNKTLNINSNHYIFIGFNALNEAEKLLFKYLKEKDCAEFYWDFDYSYVNKLNHEAGFSMRENLRLFGNSSTSLSSNYLSEKKNIELISISSDIGQVKLINNLLNQNNFALDEKTAIVLADETLLIPLLNSLPQSKEKVNITMGYPAKSTPIYSLVKHIIELQKTKTSQGFYYKNIQNILSHQYLNRNENSSIIKTLIIKENKIYLQTTELNKDEIFSKIFLRISEPKQLTKYLLDILQLIFKQIDVENNEADKIEKEYIYQLFLTIKKLSGIIDTHNIDMRIDTFFKLLSQIIDSLSIPFVGEPIAGLQIMGILETRNLDFENVIILSLNEGILPKKGATNSFIPYNLRNGFGLPTIENQDSIYAYYFYRLIQRAQNIKFIYNDKASEMQTGEMSRYIYQLKYESDFKINEKNINFNIAVNSPKEIKIKKNKNLFTKYFNSNSYLSPSALNIYMDCSLRFYFRYLAGLKEHDEISEEVDAPIFGSLLHKVLEELYTPYTNKEISKELLNNIIKDKDLIKKSILKAFTLEYFMKEESEVKTEKDYVKPEEIKGRNILIYNILEKYVFKTLEVDQNYTPFSVVSLENFYKISYPVHIDNKSYSINIGGFTDRIDRIGYAIRVIDYKTGNVKNKFKGIQELFDTNDENRSKAVFQTFLYSLFYLKNEDCTPHSIIPSVYWLKDIFSDNYDYKISRTENRKRYPVEDFKELANEFDANLQELLQGIFNTEGYFIQTEHIKKCLHCPYNKICKR